MGPETIIGTHVDDLGPSEEALDKVERAIEDHVELDKKGQPAQMLGMEIKWGKDFVVLTQTRLIETTYRQYSTIRSRLGKTSLPSNSELFEYTKVPNDDECPKTMYQALVGSLLFITRMTRPKIAIHVKPARPNHRKSVNSEPTSSKEGFGVLILPQTRRG